jgi:hypothetical protein
LTPIPDTVAAASGTDVFRSTLFTPSPMHRAFQVLKQARQTTLGEYHPDFPSPYGPMSYIRVNRMGDMDKIRREGLVPQNQLGGHNEYWDTDEGLFSPEEKQFDMTRGDGKGFFLTKPHPRNIRFASTGADKGGHGLVGVRMAPEQASALDMQYRTADESPEDLPEMLVHESIPPEQLVMMPQPANVAQGVDWHDPSTYGNVPKNIVPLAMQYGIDADFIDRNSPPDAQGRAFNFDELGEF